jgi:hypothetical protein
LAILKSGTDKFYEGVLRFEDFFNETYWNFKSF